MSAPIWWYDDGASGLCGYIGGGNDGLEFRRHTFHCKPGYWSVAITGWGLRSHAAVVDDFGNLVEVRS